MMDSRPLSYAEILRRSEASRGSLQNVSHSSWSIGGTPQRSRNSSGMDNNRPEAVFHDAINRDNPKFHSFPRRQNHPPLLKVESNFPGASNSDSLPRRKARQRQRVQQDDHNSFQKGLTSTSSQSADELGPPNQPRPHSMIIASENPIPLPSRLLQVLHTHERSSSPMWKPDQSCPTFSAMLRCHQEGCNPPLVQRPNNAEKKVYFETKSIPSQVQCSTPRAERGDEIDWDKATLSLEYQTNQLQTLRPMTLAKIEHDASEPHPDIPGLIFKSSTEVTRNSKNKRSSIKRHESPETNKKNSSEPLKDVPRRIKTVEVEEKKNPDLVVIPQTVDPVEMVENALEHGIQRTIQRSLKRRSKGSQKKSTGSCSVSKRESREYRDAMTSMKRRGSKKDTESEKTLELPPEIPICHPRKTETRIENADKQPLRSSISRGDRRKSSKKSRIQIVGDKAKDSEYHRGMSKDAIAQYLAKMEEDDFEFVHPHSSEPESRDDNVLPDEDTSKECKIIGREKSWANVTTVPPTFEGPKLTEAEVKPPIMEAPSLVVELIQPKLELIREYDADGFEKVLSNREGKERRQPVPQGDVSEEAITEILNVDIERACIAPEQSSVRNHVKNDIIQKSKDPVELQYGQLQNRQELGKSGQDSGESNLVMPKEENMAQLAITPVFKGDTISQELPCTDIEGKWAPDAPDIIRQKSLRKRAKQLEETADQEGAQSVLMPMGLLPDGNELKRNRTDSESSWAAIAAIPGPANPVVLESSQKPTAHKEEVQALVVEVEEDRKPDCAKDIDEEGFETVLNRRQSKKKMTSVLQEPPEEEITEQALMPLGLLPDGNELKRNRTDSESSWAAIAAIPGPANPVVLESSQKPTAHKEEVQALVVEVEEDRKPDYAKDIDEEGLETVLNRRQSKKEINPNKHQVLLEGGNLLSQPPDHFSEAFIGGSLMEAPKTFHQLLSQQICLEEDTEHGNLGDTLKQGSPESTSSNTERAQFEKIRNGKIEVVTTSSRGKTPKKKSYEISDHLSAVWMDEDTNPFVFEDDENPSETPFHNLTSNDNAPNHTVNDDTKGAQLFGAIPNRRTYELLDDLSSAWMDESGGLFDFGDDEEEDTQEKAILQKGTDIKCTSMKTSNPCGNIVKGESSLPVVEDSEGSCHHSYEEVQKAVTDINHQSLCAQKPNEAGNKESTEVHGDISLTARDSNLFNLVENTKAIRLVLKPENVPESKKSYDMQDEMSSTWMDENENPFEFSEGEEDDSKIIPQLATSVKMELLMLKADPELARDSTELIVDMSETQAEEIGSTFQKSSERDESTKEKDRVQKNPGTASLSNSASETPKTENKPSLRATVAISPESGSKATTVPMCCEANDKKMDIEGSVFGSSIGKKKLDNIMSSSSLDESQGKNTGGEEEVKLRDKVRKKKRRPKNKEHESSSESERETIAMECDLNSDETVATWASVAAVIPEQISTAEVTHVPKVRDDHLALIVVDETEVKNDHQNQPDKDGFVEYHAKHRKYHLSKEDETARVDTSISEPSESGPIPDLLSDCPGRKTSWAKVKGSDVDEESQVQNAIALKDELSSPERVTLLVAGETEVMKGPSHEMDYRGLVPVAQKRKRNRTTSGTKEPAAVNAPQAIESAMSGITESRNDSPLENVSEKKEDDDANFRKMASKSRFVPVAEGNKPPDDFGTFANWSRDPCWWSRWDCHEAEMKWASRACKAIGTRTKNPNSQGDDESDKGPNINFENVKHSRKGSRKHASKRAENKESQKSTPNWSDETTYLKLESANAQKQETPLPDFKVEIGNLEHDVREIEKVLTGMSDDDADRQLAITKITADTLDDLEHSANDITDRMEAILPQSERQSDLTELKVTLSSLKTAIVRNKTTAEKIRMTVENYVNERKRRNEELKSYHNMLVDLEQWLLEAQGTLGAEIRMSTIKSVRSVINKNKEYSMGLSEKREDVNQMLKQCSNLSQYQDVADNCDILSRHLAEVGSAIDDFQGVMNLRNRALQVQFM